MRISDWSSDVCSSDLPEVEEFLHVRRVEHRDHEVLEGQLALVGGGGRLGGVVVSGQQQYAAVPGAAGHVAVAKHVARAVHARALGVPNGEHAIGVGIYTEVAQLRAQE